MVEANITMTCDVASCTSWIKHPEVEDPVGWAFVHVVIGAQNYKQVRHVCPICVAKLGLVAP